MKVKKLEEEFCVCKVNDFADINIDDPFCFIGKTDEELSLVCTKGFLPEKYTDYSGGWKGFRIEGELDFSLIGIISKISTLLAQSKIGIFVVSTYNTDYVLVKEENFLNALDLLAKNGYDVV